MPVEIISDVSGDPFFFPKNRHHRQLIALFSTNPHPLSKPITQINHKPKISHKTAKKNPPCHRKPKKTECISSTTYNYYYDWRSSDDEDDIDDKTTLFSSRSFRSESSGSFRKNRVYSKKLKKTRKCRFNNPRDSGNGKVVKDSFAVAKKSSNPHEDFRVSMVEMIVEKQIFGAEELTDLLECFISLNSDEHHRVIFEAFTEILEAPF